jgi:hypothetical protein
MANNWVVRAFTATVLIAPGMGSAGAKDPMTAPWDGLCGAIGWHDVSITTRSGKTLKGACFSTNARQLTLGRGQKVVKIDRTEILRIRLRPYNRHRLLPKLGDQVADMFVLGSFSLATPAAPMGILLIPVSLAYGAVGTPICAVHDFLHTVFDKDRDVEITLN